MTEEVVEFYRFSFRFTYALPTPQVMYVSIIYHQRNFVNTLTQTKDPLK